MGDKRSGFTAAEELAFTTEVDGQCPKCGNLLFFAKRGKKLKRYEIAHIYPLNAKPEEVGFYPEITDGCKRVENFKSCLAVLRRILGLWRRSMYSNTSALAVSSVG